MRQRPVELLHMSADALALGVPLRAPVRTKAIGGAGGELLRE